MMLHCVWYYTSTSDVHSAAQCSDPRAASTGGVATERTPAHPLSLLLSC